MIPIMYIVTLFVESTSVSYLSSIIFPIGIFFLSYIASENISNEIYNNSKENSINIFKILIGKVLSMTPYSHMYKIIRLLLNSKLHSQNELFFKDLYTEWKFLSYIGIFGSLFFTTKIFIIDNLNFKIFEIILNYFIYKNSNISENTDNDVLDEIIFTNEKSNKINTVLTIKNLNKYYVTAVKHKIIYACKDVSLSLRKNEVYYI